MSNETTKHTVETLDVTCEMFDALPDHHKSALRISVRSTAGITSEAILRRRIKEYVHVMTLCNTPVLMSTFNRRFARPAKAFDTSCLDLIQRGVAAGVFETKETKGRLIIADAKVLWSRRFKLAELQPGELHQTRFEDTFWWQAE